MPQDVPERGAEVRAADGLCIERLAVCAHRERDDLREARARIGSRVV